MTTDWSNQTINFDINRHARKQLSNTAQIYVKKSKIVLVYSMYFCFAYTLIHVLTKTLCHFGFG